MVCRACGRTIDDAYFEVNSLVVCGTCRDTLVQRFMGGSGLVRFARALVLGTLAALAGSAIYFGVLLLTGYDVALIAILVGFMVGAAVRKGARHRGGLAYQVLAVVLTYTAIVSSYVTVGIVQLRSGEARRCPGRPRWREGPRGRSGACG